MDQCDTKIDLINVCGSVTYISWSIDFALYHCHRLKLFLYIIKLCRPVVFVSLQALALVVYVLAILMTQIWQLIVHIRISDSDGHRGVHSPIDKSTRP